MASKTKKTTATPVAPMPPEFPAVIETFCKPDGGTRARWIENTPSVGNGEVSVRRYRITIEEIDEPMEVLADRLRKLWSETDNYHHWGPLKREARKLGIELDPSERGVDAKRSGS